MQKIYFNDKPLYLAPNDTAVPPGILDDRTTFRLQGATKENVAMMIRRMDDPQTGAGLFLADDPSALLEMFAEDLTLIHAAGGFVYTPDQSVLMILRRGKWDLPKGKQDEGEDLLECAVREIGEETGVEGLTSGGPLLTTYHTYRQHGQHVLKASHWFLFQTNPQPCVPQAEEDIEKCEWVTFDQVETLMSNTHASIRDVIDAAFTRLQADGARQA